MAPAPAVSAGPRVSVLLPVRDAAGTLGDCLGSLGRQTLRDHEVVVIDDGSKDSSPEQLADAARADPRVRVVRTPPRGLVAALNLGLAEVRGSLVARMDADDVAAPRRLELQAQRLDAEPGLAILGCRVRLFGSAGDNAGMRRYVAWQDGLVDHDAIVRDLFVESPLAHPSVMFRAARIRDVGGYRGEGPEDYDLWLRAWQAGLRFAKLPEVLLDWRDDPGRLTRRDPRYAPAAFLAVKLAALERGPLPAGRDVVVWGAGPVGKSWVRALQARGRRVAAVVEVDPRKLGQRLHGAPVVAVDAAPGAGPLHLAAVSGAHARGRIREAAAAAGLIEGRDLVAVA